MHKKSEAVHKAKRCLMTSMALVIIVIANVLAPNQCLGISCANADLSSVGSQPTLQIKILQFIPILTK